MSQHQKERHAAAMLVHQLSSGIEALNDLPEEYARENASALYDCYTKLGNFLNALATDLHRRRA